MASFGEKLRLEREMRGTSLREIAEGTKISIRFLQALEEDRVDVLPGGLFPRAFVRQYATFLGLDAEKMVAEFAATHAVEPPVDRHVPVQPPARLRLNAGHVFLGVVAVLAIALTFRRTGAPAEQRAEAGASRARVAAAPAVLPTDRVYPSRRAEPVASAAGADGLVISMTAQEECWVEVRADGATVFNRVLAEGESQRLEARGEIVLSVGNAGGLRVRLNDRPLPLGRNGEVRKNIVITRQNLPSLVDEDRSASLDGRSG